MATTPATPAPLTLWLKLKHLLPAIEMAGNVVLLATPFAGFEPLVAGIENATQSLVQSIGTTQTPSSLLMSLYGALIGTLTILKAQPNLPAETLAEINGYLVAAEAATAAWVQAESGFDASLYTPVSPIV